MGLDSVELLIEVENTFEVTIPDAEVGRVLTVGDIVAVVCTQLAGPATARCRTQHFFYRLRRSLPLGRRSSCGPATALRKVIGTPEAYRQLAADTGLDFPPLELPRWYQNGLTTVFLSFLSLLAVGTIHYGWWWIAAMIGLAILLRKVNGRLDPRYRQLVPAVTLRHFTYQLTARNYRKVHHVGRNEREVYTVIREIIIDKMGVDRSEVTPAAALGADLGID